MATPKELETIIRISGDMDASLRKAIESAAGKIDEIETAAAKASGAMGAMSTTIKAQENALKAAQKKYASYVLEGDAATDQARELAAQIMDLSKDLTKNKAAVDKAEKAAEKLADTGEKAANGLFGMGKAAKDSSDGFTIMRGAMADLVSKGIQSVISMGKEAISTVYGLAESTREYREDMGKLETAWASTGKSTELATESYKQLYSVLGEEDRSVEAVNHLAKFVDTEQDMAKWTDIMTGVWGTFGDSLPIEGLTEAANETARVGDLTGVLADALNWAGVNEDDFQASLDAASNEQERAALITDTLNGLYTDAAGVYRDVNESIIEARYANSDYTDSLAKIGEKIEPVTTAVQGGLTKILEKGIELAGDTDLEAFADRVSDAFGYVAENVLPKVVDGIGWIIDNKEFVGGIAITIGIVAGALAALNTVLAIQSAIMAANPTTWIILGIVAAIATLIAIGVALYNNWDTIMEKVGQVAAFLTEKWNQIMEGVGGFLEIVKEKFRTGFEALVGFVMEPIERIRGFIDGLGDKIGGFIGKLTGAKKTAESISIPAYAAGGFTSGLSIAGEEAMEAVISFNPAYRNANIGYWAEAGRLLGVTADDASFTLAGSGNGNTINMGGVTFAPKISISGKADKESIMEAIEAEYPEFMDMLDRWLVERSETVYG